MRKVGKALLDGKAKFKKEINHHRKTYFLLALVMSVGFLLRAWRLGPLLGFYYDQGRDAMIIWRLWHEGKLFLLGPVTGLEGIFLGPMYYYIIAPFYLISGGNPVLPAYFVMFLAFSSLIFVYYLGWKMHSRAAGMIAVTITSLSFNFSQSARWLSNPTPIYLSGILFLLALWKIVEFKNNGSIGANSFSRVNLWWLLAVFSMSISLHFELASAVFYLPIFLPFSFWQRSKLPGTRTILQGAAIFAFFLSFQIVFNFRNDNILVKNAINSFISGESFGFDSYWIHERFKFFWSVFNTKILPQWPFLTGIFAFLSAAAIVLEWRSVNKNGAVSLLMLFLGIPMLGYLIYRGNYGILYDYYLTGNYLPLIILFAIGLAQVYRTRSGRIAVILFFVLFIYRNVSFSATALSSDLDGPTHISLGNELQAVNWIFDDAERQEIERYNVDVYVPPVIPHSYDYLFLWQGTRRCGEDLCGLVNDEQVDVLYTLYEVDPPHPDRLEAWLSRQESIGKVVDETRFGGITVQRRQRICYGEEC